MLRCCHSISQMLKVDCRCSASKRRIFRVRIVSHAPPLAACGPGLHLKSIAAATRSLATTRPRLNWRRPRQGVIPFAGLFLGGSERDRRPEHRAAQVASSAYAPQAFERDFQIACHCQRRSELTWHANPPQRPSRASQGTLHSGISVFGVTSRHAKIARRGANGSSLEKSSSEFTSFKSRSAFR